MAFRTEPHDLTTLKRAHFELTSNSIHWEDLLNAQESLRYRKVGGHLETIFHDNPYHLTERQQREVGAQGLRIMSRYLKRAGAPKEQLRIEYLAQQGAQRANEYLEEIDATEKREGSQVWFKPQILEMCVKKQ